MIGAMMSQTPQRTTQQLPIPPRGTRKLLGRFLVMFTVNRKSQGQKLGLIVPSCFKLLGNEEFSLFSYRQGNSLSARN
jgi:hypothetical protein